MSIHRRATRRDGNESEIIAKLRAVGLTVYPLDRPCDLLVGAGGHNILIELKDPAQDPSARKLTPGQEDFFRQWRGQVALCETFDECFEVIKGVVNGYGRRDASGRG